MPKTLPTSWVKNVYSLRIDARINSGVLYTEVVNTATRLQSTVYNSPGFTRFIPVRSALLSTAFFRKIPLLIAWLYPQSTGPIIKRTKEI